jgi:uncharacterized repeat protein (TIGR01451 family)
MINLSKTILKCLIPISYPLESNFFPTQFIIALVSSLIFLVIIAGYRRFLLRIHRNNAQSANEWTKTDTLTVIGIIVTLITTMLFPFFQFPLLDYTMNQVMNGGYVTFTIDITNRGLASANNVIISMKSEGMTFSNITSEPFIPNSNITSNKPGHAVVEIEVIPAAASNRITGVLNSTENNNQALTIYVRSDERVGYNNAFLIIIFYFTLLISYVLTFIYLVYWNKLKGYHVDNTNKLYKDAGSKNNAGLIKNWKQLEQRELSEIFKYFTIFVLYIILFLWTYLLIQNIMSQKYFTEFGITFELLIEIGLTVSFVGLFYKWKLFRS